MRYLRPTVSLLLRSLHGLAYQANVISESSCLCLQAVTVYEPRIVLETCAPPRTTPPGLPPYPSATLLPCTRVAAGGSYSVP